MFCHITQNWRGRPLVSREVVVNLIGNTITTDGLRIQAQLDDRDYWPSNATSSMVSGTIGSSLVTEMVERVLFKLFRLSGISRGIQV